MHGCGEGGALSNGAANEACGITGVSLTCFPQVDSFTASSITSAVSQACLSPSITLFMYVFQFLFILFPLKPIPFSVISLAKPSPPVDVSVAVSPSCLPQNLPLSVLRCSEGRPCQCVVCQRGNTESLSQKLKYTGMRETPQCSLLLTAQQKALYSMHVQYRNIHNHAPLNTHTGTQGCQRISPTGVSPSVPLSHCSHLSCTVGHTSFVTIHKHVLSPKQSDKSPAVSKIAQRGLKKFSKYIYYLYTQSMPSISLHFSECVFVYTVIETWYYIQTNAHTAWVALRNCKRTHPEPQVHRGG